MIKIGDYIKMQKRRKHQSWYDEDSYRVVGIRNYEYGEGRVLILNRPIKKFEKLLNSYNRNDEILEHFVDLDIVKTRKEKLKILFND